MGSHGRLAVVEGLLLVVVTIRAVFKIVFGEWGPGSVVTSLGRARSRTGEEERVYNVTHSSTEGVPPEVFPSLTVRERWKMGWGGERDQKRRMRSLVTKRQLNQCRLYKVSVVLGNIQQEVVS